MQTLRLPVLSTDPADAESQRSLDQAAAILRRGGLVALPTETVYGLGANALDAQAVAAIFEAKQRPNWDPLIVHVADSAMLHGVVADIPEIARQLMAAFWPGPLTLLLPRAAAVPDIVTSGRQLVGVRMPSHPVALEVIRRAGVPVAAPSANRFGRTSPTTAGHVLEDLDGRIDAVLDAGPTAFGLESTVLDPSAFPPVIYRPGALTQKQIEAVIGPVQTYKEATALDATPREALPSPGVGLSHYAPRARLLLVSAEGLTMPQLIEQLTAQAQRLPLERVGVMLPASREDATELPGFAAVFPWGNWNAPEELARRLFAGLRELDARGCTVILCPVPREDGLGAAMRDRLRKAAYREDRNSQGK